MNLIAEKAALRRSLRELRPRLQAACPDAGERAAAHFDFTAMTRLHARPIRAASVYRPMGPEIDPGPIARKLMAQGVVIALPVVMGRGLPLTFRVLTTEPLAPDAAGIPAPPPSAETVRPDLVVAPLLGFDATGARLGQGGGYYDRTLEALRRDGEVYALGLAYAGQELDALPASAHDQSLDAVLTEEGLRLFERKS